MPLKRKRKAQTLSDGVADFYRDRPDRRTPFGAAIAPKSADDMDFIARLHFSRESKRERDFDFAEQRGFTLAQKVKCHRVSGIDSSCRAVIDGALYGIAHIDDDGPFMFVYLEGGSPFPPGEVSDIGTDFAGDQ
ncbi:hypothetical protein [Adlercreutzia mucosicola]|uniref:hypothetical protein n=2 Tax=Adlercreutzia mucosicola TaxID=580026 RepID=UPI0012EC6995|nr:hypothetical protein [Adlercreutzia mucosicola]MCR2034148.1 hypothetical protein [Adlercreutzia mucosicola]